MLYNNAIGKRETFIPDLYTKAALNFVKNNVPDQFNHYRPFFYCSISKFPTKKLKCRPTRRFQVKRGRSWKKTRRP